MLTERFGEKRLDELTSLEIERFRDTLLVKKTKATANRYRDLLSAIFKRAGHLGVNLAARTSLSASTPVFVGRNRWVCDGRTWTFWPGFITIPRSKHGRSRRVPINSAARSVLLDLGSSRQRPDDPTEPVFALRPRESKVFFPSALQACHGRSGHAHLAPGHLHAAVERLVPQPEGAVELARN